MEGPLVVVLKEFPKGFIEFVKGEEGTVAQRSQDAALHPLNSHLHFCLVPGFDWAGRENGDAVMFGHFLVGAVEERFIPMGGGNSRLQIVRDQQFWYTPPMNSNVLTCEAIQLGNSWVQVAST